jgi:hypothetical protein
LGPFKKTAGKHPYLNVFAGFIGDTTVYYYSI